MVQCISIKSKKEKYLQCKCKAKINEKYCGRHLKYTKHDYKPVPTNSEIIKIQSYIKII